MRSLYELDKEIAVLMGANPDNISNSYTASKELLTAIGGNPSEDFDTNAVYKAISEGAINGAFSKGVEVPESVAFAYSTLEEFPSDIKFNKDKYYFKYLFFSNQNLIKSPKINATNGTDFYYMFSGCKNLTEVNITMSNKSASHYGMFEGCNSLTTINGNIDVTNSTNVSSMFNGCWMLQEIRLTGAINVTINFGDFYSRNTQLSYDSVKSILTAGTNKTSTSKTYITFRNLTMTDKNGELAALVAGCNVKDITINGLTLQ